MLLTLCCRLTRLFCILASSAAHHASLAHSWPHFETVEKKVKLQAILDNRNSAKESEKNSNKQVRRVSECLDKKLVVDDHFF
jgi:hypothetical protein